MDKPAISMTADDEQLFMFRDAPVVPVQAAMDLPGPEPIQVPCDPEPELFPDVQGTAMAGQPSLYLLEGSEPVGPFDWQTVADRLQQGSLSPDAHAWHSGLEDWQRLSMLFPAHPLANEAANSYASFTVRLAAGCLDLAVIVVAYFTLMLAVPPFRDWIEACSLSSHGLAIANLVLSAAIIPYFLLFFGPPGKGQTPGYRFLNIRLLSQATMHPPGWRQALLWCIGSVAMIVGWPLYWLDPSRRMLHNRISRTIVVNDLP